MTHPACLIICLTPLQALTAQSLIRAHAPTPFDLLMLCYPEADNAKFHHYFRQTAALCRQAHYAVLPVRRWAHWRSLQGLRRQLLPHYAVIFAASIDNLNVQYLLENLSYTQLETFDDGSGNLTPSGILYRNKPHSLWQRSLRRLLGVRRDTEDFRRHSTRHHTLYPGLPNIATPTGAAVTVGSVVVRKGGAQVVSKVRARAAGSTRPPGRSGANPSTRRVLTVVSSTATPRKLYVPRDKPSIGKVGGRS